MKETVNWETDFAHAGEFEIDKESNMADKVARAWVEHNAKFPSCTLCDMMTISEDLI